MLELKLTSNDPRKIGEIHGETFKNQIKELFEIRFKLLMKFLKGWTLEEVTTICLESYSALSEHEELFEEFEGIREAADLSPTELMIVNNYTDLRDFSGRDEEAPTEDGCSALSVHTPRLRWAGQTWDMHTSAAPYTLLMHLKDGTKILTITGCLGLAGVNAWGLSILINNMHCREFTDQHIPWPALVRILLREKDTKSAVRALQKNLPCSGHNYLLCDAKTSINVETTGIRTEITGSVVESNGYLIHTNHYLGSLAKQEIMDRQSPTTHKRMKALEEFFKKNPLGTLTEEQIKKEIFLTGAAAKEVCIAKDPKDPHKAMTAGGMFVNYTTRTFEAFAGLYKDGDVLKSSF